MDGLNASAGFISPECDARAGVQWGMKHFRVCLLAAAVLIAMALPSGAAQDQRVTWYVQLIQGTVDARPPGPEARPAGREVVQRLQMFKWSNYWEMKRETVTLRIGEKSRLRMTDEQEVEIAPGPQDVTVSIYTNGRVSRRRRQSLATPFYIAGGEKGVESWFIVVRKDPPAD